jgi:hypothetical protein
MARNPQKHPPRDGKTRRQRIEEMRAEQRRADRKRTALIVGTAGVLAVALVVGVVFAIQYQNAHDPKTKPIASFGVPAADAGCSPEVTKASTASQVHVGPGTNTPNETFVKYETVPPMFGPHFVTPAPFGTTFYTTRDRPKVETLVHNLEHGYTVVWYDSTITGDQLDQLKGLSERIPAAGTPKFIVSAWDTAHGTFPAGKHVAFSHWGQKSGYMQLCAKVSGEAVQTFVDRHPYVDSPEPNGA